MADTYNDNVAILLRFEDLELSGSNILSLRNEVCSYKNCPKKYTGTYGLVEESIYKFGTKSFNGNSSLYDLSNSGASILRKCFYF